MWKLVLFAVVLSFLTSVVGSIAAAWYVGAFSQKNAPLSGTGKVSWPTFLVTMFVGYMLGRAVMVASWPVVLLWSLLNAAVSFVAMREILPAYAPKKAVAEYHRMVFAPYSNGGSPLVQPGRR